MHKSYLPDKTENDNFDWTNYLKEDNFEIDDTTFDYVNIN